MDYKGKKRVMVQEILVLYPQDSPRLRRTPYGSLQPVNREIRFFPSTT